MAMEMSSFQRELVHQQRPVMSTDIFLASMRGDEDVLIRRLELLKEQKEIKVTIEASHSAPNQLKEEHQTVQSELQSATCLGDTVLHLLVIKRHNELVVKVFQRDMSLLRAQNKKFETALHCAAKVGNEEVIQNFIQIDLTIVKGALKETDENRDTALHVAAQHGHIHVGHKLMMLDPKVAYTFNKKRSSPLYVAIVNGYSKMVEAMLEVDPTLACTPFLDGMFSVHVAAHMGNVKLINHFMEKYPDDAKLVDPCGRNLFHIAVEENKTKLFSSAFGNQDASVKETIARMNNATDYKGNTPFHIAAMKGHRTIMWHIWRGKMNQVAETIKNNESLTPLELSMRELEETPQYDVGRITWYITRHGYKFTSLWFQYVMIPSNKNKWEKSQVIGLGSVLITTVTFAAAFAIPGGYNQNDGTPLLGRRYMFRAFILANASAFIQGFLSLSGLVVASIGDLYDHSLHLPTYAFMFAASSMVVAFGLGLYLMFAPVCLPIAIILLVITLFLGSPAGIAVVDMGHFCFRNVPDILQINQKFESFVVAIYAMFFLLIFCLALL